MLKTLRDPIPWGGASLEVGSPTGGSDRMHTRGFRSLVRGREMSVSLNMANQNAINIIFDFVFIQHHLRATTKTKSNHLLLLLSRISLDQLTRTPTLTLTLTLTRTLP